jgi:hypothetical protein
VVDQLLIGPDIGARAARTGQLALLDPRRGYSTRTPDDVEAT